MSSSLFKDLQLVTIIAKGRYSQVYKCINKKTSEIYAIKKHPSILLGYKKECNTRELEALELLGNENGNIIKLFGYLEDEDDGYFILEYFNGYDLNRVINESKNKQPEKQISFSSILDILIQILEGIQFLHSKGVYHCDIKPENILVHKDTIKIVDFGSSIISKEKEINVKKEDFLGTPGFLPPEVIDTNYKGNINLEFLDAFGFGSTLYFCITKQIPFQGKMSADTKNNVINMKINLEEIQNEDIKEILKHIFTKNDRWNICQIKDKLLNIRNKYNNNINSEDIISGISDINSEKIKNLNGRNNGISDIISGISDIISGISDINSEKIKDLNGRNNESKSYLNTVRKYHLKDKCTTLSFDIINDIKNIDKKTSTEK